jgi:hypothetical protein
MSQSEYCKYYEAQRGGEIPVFRGGVQTGAGLGDILRGIFRFLTPLALRGMQTFAGNTLAAAQAGVPLGQAAKSAIMPTISAVAGSAAPAVSRIINAVAPGIVAGGNPSGSRATQQTGSGTLFDGENGIPTTPKAISQYKRSGPPAVGFKPKSKRRKTDGSPDHTAIHYNF